MRSSYSRSPTRSVRLFQGEAVGGFRYSRKRDLPRLIPMWPEELGNFTLGGSEYVVSMLYNQLRRERRRGLAGDWSYSLPRHRQLLIAYKAERAALAKARGKLGVR